MRVLLLNWGRGWSLASPGRIERIRARARAVFDVSGAGDTVCAVVAAGVSAGAGLSEAVELAAHAAALGVAKVGVATVAPEEISEALAGP